MAQNRGRRNRPGLQAQQGPDAAVEGPQIQRREQAKEHRRARMGVVLWSVIK
jgi:hypothetical protein